MIPQYQVLRRFASCHICMHVHDGPVAAAVAVAAVAGAAVAIAAAAVGVVLLSFGESWPCSSLGDSCDISAASGLVMWAMLVQAPFLHMIS